MARSHAEMAASAAYAFAAAAASGASSVPFATAHPAQYVSARALSASTNASASLWLTAGSPPTGRPNCSRVLACSTAISRAREATPTASAARPARARSRTRSSRAAASEPSASRVPVAPDSASRPSGRVESTVGSGSHEDPAPSRSAAHSAGPSAERPATTTSSAAPRSGTNMADPDSRQPSAFRSPATAGSSPGPGHASVAARFPATTSATRSGSAASAGRARATVEKYGPGNRARPVSSRTTTSSMNPMPRPPASSGTDTPVHPSAVTSGHHAGSQPEPSAIWATRSTGNRDPRNSRTDAASAFWSSLSVKSTSASLREAQDPLGDDVAEDLRGPALDGVAAAPELEALPQPVLHRVLAPRQHRVRPLYLDGQLG